MSVNLESLLKNNLDNYMEDVYTCIPAMVVGVQKLNEGLVDVQPLINNVFTDGAKVEFPTIYAVPVIMPCTMKSSITMPVNHGDTVLLMFSQRDIDVFKNGGDSPHDPSSFRRFNMNDAVALIGLNPVNKTRLSAKNHNIPFDNESLIIAHNVGEDNESYIKFDNSGSINIGATSNLNIKAKSVDINADAVSINASKVDIKATVTVDGMNLNNFMTSHNHPYTDDGRPATTGTPQGF